VADDPFFPQPRAKGSYREPAQRELVVTDAKADEPKSHEPTESDEPVREKPVITRPLRPEEMPPSVRKEPRTGRIAEEEQHFWRNHSLVARYPRSFAALLTLIGAVSTWDSMWTLMHGGFYSRRALFGPPMLAAGLFPLICGFPSHPTEGNPRWWKIGYGVTFGIGVLGGVILTYYLAYAASRFGR
jgi:hypothetical protein